MHCDFRKFSLTLSPKREGNETDAITDKKEVGKNNDNKLRNSKGKHYCRGNKNKHGNSNIGINIETPLLDKSSC